MDLSTYRLDFGRTMRDLTQHTQRLNADMDEWVLRLDQLNLSATLPYTIWIDCASWTTKLDDTHLLEQQCLVFRTGSLNNPLEELQQGRLGCRGRRVRSKRYEQLFISPVHMSSDENAAIG